MLGAANAAVWLRDAYRPRTAWLSAIYRLKLYHNLAALLINESEVA